MLLYSLSESLETFRCAIKSRDELPDPKPLKITIMEEYDSRKQKQELESGAMYLKYKNVIKHYKNNTEKNEQYSPHTIQCAYKTQVWKM